MTDVKVTIGLRPSSKSNEEARACGFTEADGTLGEVFDVVAKSDLTILLTSDASQARRSPWLGFRAELAVRARAGTWPPARRTAGAGAAVQFGAVQ